MSNILNVMKASILPVFIVLWVSTATCSETTDIHSSFDLERNELLNRMRRFGLKMRA